ncbi:PACE efflux transporter [Frigidibacter sp. ROC022]|uniref:PACE efflux transporter n=1 Tax=Frigidibacter sp. ROC022 TaxID=2971796 RepID=UPI003083B215
MRSPFDRIRQAVSFELIGLILVTTLGAAVFDHGAAELGGIAVIGATLAMLWNYLYNLGFDHLLLRTRRSTRKTLPLRVVHALAFEAGLLLAMMPIIAWWLGVGLIEALVMDLAFAGFYLVYAFLFTWAYDRLFPVPDPAPRSFRTTAPAPSDRDPATAANAIRNRSNCAR